MKASIDVELSKVPIVYTFEQALQCFRDKVTEKFPSSLINITTKGIVEEAEALIKLEGTAVLVVDTIEEDVVLADLAKEIAVEGDIEAEDNGSIRQDKIVGL